MNVHHIRAEYSRFEKGDKGVYYSLKTLNPWGITFDQLNPLPVINLLGDIRVPCAKNNLMPFGSDTREELLAVFFNSAWDVGNASCACNKNFQSPHLPQAA